MSIIVDLAAATICFSAGCFPALVGADTPRGSYQLVQYATKQRGLGGDILVFKETNTDLYAIHRLIDVPKQDRRSRIKSKDPKIRQITAGCINVDDATYKKIIDCCKASTLIIR